MVSVREIGCAVASIVAAAASADAFGTASPATSASEAVRAGLPPFERLAAVELTSVATGRPARVTDLWTSDASFPWQRNGRCVVEIFRHFG